MQSLTASEAVKGEVVSEHGTVVPHCYRQGSETWQAEHLDFSDPGAINPGQTVILVCISCGRRGRQHH